MKEKDQEARIGKITEDLQKNTYEQKEALQNLVTDLDRQGVDMMPLNPHINKLELSMEGNEKGVLVQLNSLRNSANEPEDTCCIIGDCAIL